jgi:hypothetical protein
MPSVLTPVPKGLIEMENGRVGLTFERSARRVVLDIFNKTLDAEKYVVEKMQLVVFLLQKVKK